MLLSFRLFANLFFPKPRTFFDVCLIDGVARIFPARYAVTGNQTRVSSVAPYWGTLIQDTLRTELPRLWHLLDLDNLNWNEENKAGPVHDPWPRGRPTRTRPPASSWRPRRRCRPPPSLAASWRSRPRRCSSSTAGGPAACTGSVARCWPRKYFSS